MLSYPSARKVVQDGGKRCKFNGTEFPSILCLFMVLRSISVKKPTGMLITKQTVHTIV